MIILARLKSRRVEAFDTLRQLVKKRISGGDVLFLPSVNLLFVLGLVDYRPKTDAFEYVGPT